MATVFLPETPRKPETSLAPGNTLSLYSEPGPGKKAKKWMIAVAALTVVSLSALILLSNRTEPPQYTTARIDRGSIDSTVTTTGNLNAVITVQVGSQVSGNIIALYADFNTKVKKGQLVAEIDPAPFQAAVDQAKAILQAAQAAVVTARATLAQSQASFAAAQANVASQKANLVKAQSAANLAKVENDRRQIMVQTGSTSQEDADTAKATYDQALASMDAAEASIHAAQSSSDAAQKAVEVAQTQLEQAKAVVAENQASLAQAQLNLNHTRILAPVDGTVESRNMDVGQTVAASFSAPIIFLIAQDLTKMQVDTNVDESDVGQIRLDQAATFTVDAYPGQIFHGRVAQIRQAPINVQNVITYDIVIAVSNPDLKLFPGMTANATIFTGHAAGVLRIPKAALRYHPPGKTASTQAVYVPDRNGLAKAVPVTTGIGDANHVELVSGDLQEGEEVITGNLSKGSGSPSSSQGKNSGKRLGF
jgi:HlyD family secretion protein